MSRLPFVNMTALSAARKAVLDQVQAAFGATPNMFKTVAHSAAALHSI